MEKSGSPCRVRPEGDDVGKCDRKRWWSAAFVGRYTATISRDYCLEIRKPPLRTSRHHPSVYHDDPEKMDCTMTTTMDIRIYSIMYIKYILLLYIGAHDEPRPRGQPPSPPLCPVRGALLLLKNIIIISVRILLLLLLL